MNQTILESSFLFLNTGSPFKFTVGPINSGGAEKVLAVGQGLISASVDEPGFMFTIYICKFYT